MCLRRSALAIAIFIIIIGVEMASTSTSWHTEAVGFLTLEATFTEVANGWEKVERLKDNNPNFPVEDYLLDGRGDQDGQRLTFFADKRPHSSRFLLYYAANSKTNLKPYPVLLVHGANDNVDRAWANPNEYGFCGAPSCPKTGLMQLLTEQGYRVFAINFPHKQGDNYLWAQQIHAAIARIKGITGAAYVDVIAWSKGAFATHMYVSNVKPSWGASYRGDIRKLILLGSPNLGIDYTFRHGAIFNSIIFPNCGGLIKVNGPSPHTAMLCQDKWQTFSEYSIYTTASGNFFPGQKQMLRRWDKIYSLPQNELDWQTTYYGGKGEQTEGLGIDAAIAQGELVSQIRRAGIPASITVYLLAGKAATIPFFHNEHTGPSDGLVFIDSATNTDGIGKVAAVTVIEDANHLQLAWHSRALSQINEWLEK
ncbi:MAG: lipase [Acidobacteriota bacterium]